MAHHDIRVDLLDHCCMTETDQHGDAHQIHSHRITQETFRWRSPDGALRIDFGGNSPTEHPFTANPLNIVAAKGAWTDDFQVADDKPIRSYKYKISLTYDAHVPPCVEDPQVIIDPGNFMGGGSPDDRLELSAGSAKVVFDTLINKLKEKADGPGPRLFFPNGIELIKVEFDVGKNGTVASANVVVAGKDGVPGAKTMQLRLDDDGESEV